MLALGGGTKTLAEGSPELIADGVGVATTSISGAFGAAWRERTMRPKAIAAPAIVTAMIAATHAT